MAQKATPAAPATECSTHTAPAPYSPRPELLSRPQVAALIGVSLQCLASLIRAGTIPPPIVLGRKVHRWHREAIMAHIAALTSKQGGKA